MPRRTRYQQGSVQCEKRRSGPDVWVFRWWQSTSDGGTKRRKAIVGTIAALPTEAAALRAAQALRIDANQETPQTEGGPSTIAELIAHYRLKELAGEDQGRKAFSTRAAYECYLRTWVQPRWGTHRLDQIKPVAVEEWLGGIKRSRGTKAKIRNLMSALFHHAMRYEWIERNPIKLVRQSAKREKVPDVLELAELQLLLSKLAVRERTRETAILRTLGFTPAEILQMVVGESILISVIGGIVGLGLGWILATGLTAVAGGFGFRGLKWQAGSIVLVMAILVGFLASLVPAVIASRKNVVESLRFTG